MAHAPTDSTPPARLGRRRLLALGAVGLLLPAPLAARERAGWVEVIKSEGVMRLMRGERVLRDYRVALGRRPVGHKEQKGDGRTPEGRYILAGRRDVGQSAFHRSIAISYPNREDIARARARGVSPGGNIAIHGLPNGISAEVLDHPDYNWTDGCIAVTNEEMDEIWELVADGTPIHIHP